MSPETENFEARYRASKIEEIGRRLRLGDGKEEQKDALRAWAEEVERLEESAQEKIENINYPYGDVKIIISLRERNGQKEISIDYFGIVT